jgi:hypothetical protein
MQPDATRATVSRMMGVSEIFIPLILQRRKRKTAIFMSFYPANQTWVLSGLFLAGNQVLGRHDCRQQMLAF